MDQPEIFGRFVLVEAVDDDERRPQSFRALDLDRHIQPVVVVRRIAPWTRSDPATRQNHRSAIDYHASLQLNGAADFIDAGQMDGFDWSARTWVEGISLRSLIDEADARGEVLPIGVALSIIYVVSNVLLEASATSPSSAVISLQPRPRRLIVTPDGRVRLLGPTIRNTFGDIEERRIVGASDATMFADTIATIFAAGGGEVPSEIARRVTGLANETVSVAEFTSFIRPLMDAAGGGSYNCIADFLGEKHAAALGDNAARQERDSQLARRLQERRRAGRGRSSEGSPTMKLRIRPASQEGPARLERVEATPHGMVLVSGGRFLFSQAVDVVDYVDLKPFFVDRTPITWSAYAAFCAETGHAPPSVWPEGLRQAPSPEAVPEHLRRTPVTGITHADAEAFAAAQGKRLPTEAEWELAARGFDGRIWAYGDTFDEGKTGKRWRKTAPIDDQDPITDEELAVVSPFGVSLLGYAWEWTSTPAGDLADASWVVRGGQWRNRVEPPSLVNRSREEAAAPDVTFRCARDVFADAVEDGADVDVDIDDILERRDDQTDEDEAVT